MTNWKIINTRIKQCQQLMAPEKVINCLLDLFQQTNDGWVAFHLAQEYENWNKLGDALLYYQEAEVLLPITSYKEMAKEAISRVKRNFDEEKVTKIDKRLVESLSEISQLEPIDTLLIVPCGPEKIWNVDPTAPDFVPARYAYKTEKFLKFIEWAEKNDIEKKRFYWVILSGRYGFIEPWHPVSRYDINLSDPNDYPISDSTLQNQVNQERWWRDNTGNLVKIKLANFKNIICINCSTIYKNKIVTCFPQAEVQSVDIDGLL